MKKKIKIQLPDHVIEAIFPGALSLKYLPRKKKKALKKKISAEIIKIAYDDVLKMELVSRLSTLCNTDSPDDDTI